MKPSSGTAKINNVDIINEPTKTREQIGVISHKTHLYGGLTAEENLKFYGKLYGIKNPRDKSQELIDKVGLGHRRKDRVNSFSRGMKQRISIARALIHDPSVLLLDEPYTGLDQESTKTLEDILKKFKDKTILLTTHNLERGLKICEKISILVNGEIVYLKEKNKINKKEFKRIYNKKLEKND